MLIFNDIVYIYEEYKIEPLYKIRELLYSYDKEMYVTDISMVL